MDCTDHGVTKSQTQMSDFHFHKYDKGCQDKWTSIGKKINLLLPFTNNPDKLTYCIRKKPTCRRKH